MVGYYTVAEARKRGVKLQCEAVSMAHAAGLDYPEMVALFEEELIRKNILTAHGPRNLNHTLFPILAHPILFHNILELI